jgi:hypothetical protein
MEVINMGGVAPTDQGNSRAMINRGNQKAYREAVNTAGNIGTAFHGLGGMAMDAVTGKTTDDYHKMDDPANLNQSRPYTPSGDMLSATVNWYERNKKPENIQAALIKDNTSTKVSVPEQSLVTTPSQANSSNVNGLTGPLRGQLDRLLKPSIGTTVNVFLGEGGQ